MLSQGRKADRHPPQEEPQACHVLKPFLNTRLLSNLKHPLQGDQALKGGCKQLGLVNVCCAAFSATEEQESVDDVA